MKQLVAKLNIMLSLCILFPAWAYALDTEPFMKDVHTQSNFNDVSVKHLSLNLSLDMDQQYFFGYVDLTLKNVTKKDSLILDTKGLLINRVAIINEAKEEIATEFILGDMNSVLGQALTIKIDPNVRVVRVYYRTTKESVGLDWIDAKLTESKLPMVVTQFQAINARSFVPCQDTPAQKITYDAAIKLISSTMRSDMRVIMAATARRNDGGGAFSFNMSIPIPTYLIALAAGVFHERPIGDRDRVSVIAEPSIVEKAAREFADAEKMIQAAEQLLGPYAWKRFDIFIMPPSFSYGGMENPTMTFIGPTVIAGDKSLVSVIAHELAHSWAGNWVTNQNWEEFWINEGTTTYIERLIIESLYGKDYRDLENALGQQVLKDNIDLINRTSDKALTCLHVKLAADFPPDDAVTHVPYEKGANFWLALEQAYGQPAVLAFLKQYFADFAQGVMTSQKLKDLIIAFPYFYGAKKVDIDDWFYNEGIPKAGLPKIESVFIEQVDQALTQIKAENSHNGISHLKERSQFNTKQWSYFLKSIKVLPSDDISYLQKNFEMTAKNDEVKSNFYELAIRSGVYDQFEKNIDSYLGQVGRIKYVGPIYQALIDKKQIECARSLFDKHQPHNNAITNGSIKRRLE